MSKLRHPEEWEQDEGYWVRDPDGWRNTGISWDTPITREQFIYLAGQSTTETMPGRHGRPLSASDNTLRIKAQTNTLENMLRGR